MPGPFPGMDPYLECPHLWRGFHHGLVCVLNSQLNALLPRGFVARIDQREYYQGDLRCREGFVEVFRVGERECPVSAVEVLSPTNKVLGTGHKLYRRRQHEVRERGINLLEIDLLREGAHTVLAPEDDLRAQFDEWDYLISLYRAAMPEECDAWPISIRRPLPAIPVPLMGEHPPVIIDLQAALDRAYDEGAFDRSIDYTGEPVPPLAPDDAAWADTLLKAASLRPHSATP